MRLFAHNNQRSQECSQRRHWPNANYASHPHVIAAAALAAAADAEASRIERSLPLAVMRCCKDFATRAGKLPAANPA